MIFPETMRAATIDRRRFYERARSRWLRPVPDALRRMEGHACAASVLRDVGHATLAAGADVVTAVVALRLAAAPSATDEDTADKWDAIRTIGSRLASPSAARFARLCEAARPIGADRWIGRDVPTPVPSTPQATRTIDPAARGLYTDVLWAADHLDAIMGMVADTLSDARELGRLGFASAAEGARAYLCDVALALCVGPPARAAEVGIHARLLEALRPAARGRPVVAAMIDVATASGERDRRDLARGAP